MKRNKFDLSHQRLSTASAGKLLPFLLLETLPGDIFRIGVQMFTRLMPLIAPVFSLINVRLYIFHIPLRLIWNDAEMFFTRGKLNTSTLTVPRLVVTNTNKAEFARLKLPDYFGIPPIGAETVSGNHYFSVLPFRALVKVYNDIFRNQETEDEIVFDKSSSDASASELTLLTTQRYRSWDLDYFTEAKTRAGIRSEVNDYTPIQPVAPGVTALYKDNSVVKTNVGGVPANTGISTGTGLLSNAAYTVPLRIENLNDPLGFDIDDLRRVSALKRWMTTLINVGYRYADYLKGVWQQQPEDVRLDIVEYLGGKQMPVRISEVLSTAETTTANVGEYAGHGVASGDVFVNNYEVKEHGIILGLYCISPKSQYFQGVETMWKRFDHMEFANPLLDDLGPQELKTSELYYNFADSEATNIVNFGYKPRFADYKSGRDIATGEFRDNLRYWHLGRVFASRPTMTNAFIKQTDVRTDIFPVTTGDHYITMFQNNVSVLRNLSYFSVPVI